MQQNDPHRDQESWEKEAPLLSSLKGQQPHEPPEGYFDALPDQLMDRIRKLEPTPSDPISQPDQEPAPLATTRRFWNWQQIGIAATLAILIGTGIFFWTRNSAPSPLPPADQELLVLESQLDQLSEEEILDALELENVAEEEMIELMGDEALASVEAEAFGQGFFEEDIELDALDFEELDLQFEDLEDFLNEK